MNRRVISSSSITLGKVVTLERESLKKNKSRQTVGPTEKSCRFEILRTRLSVEWLHFSAINRLICMFISSRHSLPDLLSVLTSPLFNLISILPLNPRREGDGWICIGTSQKEVKLSLKGNSPLFSLSLSSFHFLSTLLFNLLSSPPPSLSLSLLWSWNIVFVGFLLKKTSNIRVSLSLLALFCPLHPFLFIHSHFPLMIMSISCFFFIPSSSTKREHEASLATRSHTHCLTALLNEGTFKSDTHKAYVRPLERTNLDRSILSVSCRHASSLSLRFTQQKYKTRGNKEREVEREERRRTRWTRERQMDEQRERGKTTEMENVRFDVIVWMSGFPIYSRLDWQEGEGVKLAVWEPKQ